jgi:hypothetical protein
LIVVHRIAATPRGATARASAPGFFENFTNPAQVRQVSSVNTFSDAVEIHWKN